MLSPRAPNLVPISGPRMERETSGQRPRPNHGHPDLDTEDLVEVLDELAEHAGRPAIRTLLLVLGPS